MTLVASFQPRRLMSLRSLFCNVHLSERSHMIQDNVELRLTSPGISSVLLEQELCKAVLMKYEPRSCPLSVSPLKCFQKHILVYVSCSRYCEVQRILVVVGVPHSPISIYSAFAVHGAPMSLSHIDSPVSCESHRCSGKLLLWVSTTSQRLLDNWGWLQLKTFFSICSRHLYWFLMAVCSPKWPLSSLNLAASLQQSHTGQETSDQTARQVDYELAAVTLSCLSARRMVQMHSYSTYCRSKVKQSKFWFLEQESQANQPHLT